MEKGRRSGVLLHISSLPGAFGVGDFGPEAFAFADYLHGAGFSVWQILPLSPAISIFGYSPYSSPSAFAGNMLFISPRRLRAEGLITEAELSSHMLPAASAADFDAAGRCRRDLLSLDSTATPKPSPASAGRLRIFAGENPFGSVITPSLHC